jgi:iron complex transport system ATP-binding protein
MTVVIQNLRAGYRDRTVLRDIDTSARPGRITVIIGPNAAGKSTLLRCILGSLRPRQGHVLIDSEPSHRLPARHLASRIAWVSQRPQVSAPFTVREIVTLGRYALSPAPGRVEEAIEQLSLRGICDRAWQELSVGQQQRVALARALAQISPDGHLLLDEPTSAMDLGHVRQALSLLRHIADAGASVIVATHDLPIAAGFADAVWVLDDGRLVDNGPVDKAMSPDRLESVFGVPFAWINGPDEQRHLISLVVDPGLQSSRSRVDRGTE